MSLFFPHRENILKEAHAFLSSSYLGLFPTRVSHPLLRQLAYAQPFIPPTQRGIIREERLGERVGCGGAQKTTEKQERTSSNIFTERFSPFIQPLHKSVTWPRRTSSSSSTQGLKSWRTTILLSGPRPASFSSPTRTRVSMLADPVIRPMDGMPRNASSSAAEQAGQNI
jgi:hypothetical protein